MTFEAAVRAAPHPVNGAYRPGKQALEKGHRKHVTCVDSLRLTGSLDLDGALAREPRYAKQPRWDYGLGYKPSRNRPFGSRFIPRRPARFRRCSGSCNGCAIG